MIIECDRCYARYRYDESRFEGRSSKKVCTKCLAVFEIYNTPAYEAQTTVPPDAELAAPDWKPGEDTGRAKDAAKRKRAATTAERRRTPAELKLPTDANLSLAVISGPDAGKIFQIAKPRVVIGRQGADINVEDPEISRAHAALEVAGEHITLVDLGSTNGTYMGEDQVAEASLENQAEFTVGGTTLMLIVTTPR